MKYLTLTEASRVWMPDLFFKNEKEGHFHNIIMPNVYIRIFPHGSVLYSIRYDLRIIFLEKLLSLIPRNFLEKGYEKMLYLNNERDKSNNLKYQKILWIALYTFLNVNIFYRISLLLSCPMNLKLYPLDRQTCSLTMASCKQ